MPSLLRSKQQLLHRARIQGVLNHPKARKINQIQKSIRRVDAKQRVLASIKAGRNRDEEQLFWIAAAMQRLGSSPNCNSYINNNNQNNNNNDEQPGLLPIVMEAIVHLYIHRNDKELAELKKKRQPPRGQIRKIEIQAEEEMAKFGNGKGFLVPPFETRGDINLTMEWLDTVIEFEESYAEVQRKLHDPELDRDEKKKLKVPQLPPAFILRTSVKTSKKGNVTPTDDFVALLNQLSTQEGIGEHLIDANEENNNKKDGNNNNGENDDDMPEDTFFQNQSHDQGQDLAMRKKRRRRFGKIKKIHRSSEDDSGNTNNNINSAAAGVKQTNIQDVAVAGMARRMNIDKADRLKRRSLALQAARRD